MTAAWQGFMTPAEGQAEETDWSDYSVAQLKTELEKRGLPKSGSKDELIQRLQDADGS